MIQSTTWMCQYINGDGYFMYIWVCMYMYVHICIYIDGLVQERRNSIANALELCLSCTNLSIWGMYVHAWKYSKFEEFQHSSLHCIFVLLS